MTLLVSGRTDSAAWMVADTAISSAVQELRDRKYWPKIAVIGDSAVLGFSGDVALGIEAQNRATKLEPGNEVLAALLAAHRNSGGAVDFAYSHVSEGNAKLHRIAEGAVVEGRAFHLGNTAAFERFQRLRHSKQIDHAPNSIHHFISGIVGDEVVPDDLQDATTSMLRLFAATGDRDVGGWATPYLITAKGVFMLSYVYNVTDQVVDDLKVGGLIPHGTAAGGGFGLSVSPLKERDGMVIYWLQRPGGLVYIRNDHGYSEYSFDGRPAPFKAAALEAIKRDVHVWFSEDPMPVAEPIAELVDQNDRKRVGVHRDGRNFSLSWMQKTDDSFRSSGTIDFPEEPGT